jgi:hypothetical protein
MARGGQWDQWVFTDQGFTLNIGRSFFGSVCRVEDGRWKATLNSTDFGNFRDRDAAMERVEYEITMLLRLALEDLTEFRPKRPQSIKIHDP